MISPSVADLELLVFSGEGHMLANERPAVAAREILAFFDHDKGPMADGTAR